MSEKYTITVRAEAQEVSFFCRHDQAILLAMEQAGLAVVPVGCRGGGCGICKIKVIDGTFKVGKMSRAHVSASDEQTGATLLACRTFPSSNINLEPTGKLFRKLNRVPASARP